VTPSPEVTPVPTTSTPWGDILDAPPDDFPVYPDAAIAALPDEPVSAAFLVPVSVPRAAGWYRDRLAGLGWRVMVGDPLEDGSRVLDARSEVPECRLQLTFRPAGTSTMITLLYAAACGPL